MSSFIFTNLTLVLIIKFTRLKFNANFISLVLLTKVIPLLRKVKVLLALIQINFFDIGSLFVVIGILKTLFVVVNHCFETLVFRFLDF